MNEEIVTVVQARAESVPSHTGQLDTAFPPPPLHLQAFWVLLGLALLFVAVCTWQWMRNLNSFLVWSRCRVVLSATAAALLYLSAICLLLDIMLFTADLVGTGPAAAGMRMLAYAETMEHFRVGFAGFTVTSLLALLMGLFEPRAPSPPEDPVART